MYTRRNALVMLATPATAFGQQPAHEPPYSDRLVADKWLREWMASFGAATGTLHLGRFADAIYFLREQIEWSRNPDDGKDLPDIVVPKGFVTDFASIPQVFWSLLPKDGKYTYPAIIHDYLYWAQSTTRNVADRILDSAMKEFGVSDVQRVAVNAGVSLGGGFAWNGNKKLKQSGERRILKTYPTDPKVSWETYKAGDVFL